MAISVVRGAPQKVRSGRGVLRDLSQELLDNHFSKINLITGLKSWEVAKPYLNLPFEPNIQKYAGDCTLEEVDRLAELCSSSKGSIVIGVGGGKVLDLSKAVSVKLGIPVVLIPTIISNCSPWAPLSVFYRDHQYTHFEVFEVSSWSVYLDTDLLIQTPTPYFIQGIGDTLAKWYECDCLYRQLDAPNLLTTIGHQSAKQCFDQLIKYSEEALTAVQTGKVNHAFRHVYETIIGVAGMVGGFGDRVGRIAGAHSIHNGLTALDGTHNVLHGAKVAYGILVQLALEGQIGEIDRLLPFYQKLGLPINLKDLDVEPNILNMQVIAKRAVNRSESIHFMREEPYKADEVVKAIQTVESIAYV
ncbi:iron-containing alcohol dehydrogenase family protein [Terrilactibacillus laevilacticus]|uniref:iron-containing alcohol dehydrogenase family protein n=1 Tax=Terrilactibacillus laevilacticus TaxID=1380157 RepID=UPI001146F7C8|nr:iron-containing alcohol dehydrogenase family protein [Terrilactibacillus laevilacticus]